MRDIGDFDAIIFDLGGVILNIDHDAPVRAFAKLGIPDFEQYYSKISQSSLFVDLEIGAISPGIFRNRLRENLPVDLSDKVIDEAWNSILLDFPEERIRLLERLQNEYRVFLLSNTNVIHFHIFSQRLKARYGYSQLSELMEKTYYSHEVGMRKPDLRIFHHVISDAHLEPERTLFIDDSEQHIVAAKQAGLRTYHLKDGDSIIRLFNK